MKRVLFIVSSFKPAMVADMQRARMLAWELPKLGWDVEVLTPRATEVRQDIIEPSGGPFFPPGLIVHETGSSCRRLFEMVGSHAHGWRTLWPLFRRGKHLLRTKRFDLVYFSTTAFLYFGLGRLWRREFGVPYVLDFHDPWFAGRPNATRLRRGWKRRFEEVISDCMERSAVVNAAGLVAVSPRYIAALRSRYAHWQPAWLADERNAVIPFGALEGDFAAIRRPVTANSRHDSSAIKLVYVGAGGLLMKRSFHLICRAVAALREQGCPHVDRLRIELYGTSYGWKEGDPKHLEEVARQTRIGDMVREYPSRVTYRRSLELLLQSDGALILGVDDTGYMPSKLFSYALSGKPLLASLHRASPAYECFQWMPGLGHALNFDGNEEMPAAEASPIMARFLDEAAARQTFDRRQLLEPCLAPAMARRHVEIFEACLRESKNHT